MAVQFNLERFNQYTYGKKVEVESDHKPLEAIVKKSLTSAPSRLQRILLRMQRYDYSLTYKPGKELVIPSMLSRAPLPDTDNSMDKEVDLHVHTVTSNVPATKSKLDELREATANDKMLRDLREIIKSGWPETKSHAPVNTREYWDIRDELSEIDGIIFKGDRIVVPPSQRKEMLERIHQEHMGREKSQRRTVLVRNEFPNQRYGSQMQYLFRTQKRKHEGTNDSFQNTKPPVGSCRH